jgi:hypothetical protein
MSFRSDLDELVRPMDPSRWDAEIKRLRSCRSVGDLDRVAKEGWLSSNPIEPRLKLVKHGSGTFLVVEYKDGWSTRVSMQPFR